MSVNLKNTLPILEAIARIKSREERKIVIYIFCRDKQFVKAIKEIAKNTVEGNVPLSVKDKHRLKKQKAVLTALAGKGGKRVIKQQGAGFLPVLVPIVSAILGSIING